MCLLLSGAMAAPEKLAHAEMQPCKESVWAQASRRSRRNAGFSLVRAVTAVLLAVVSVALPSLSDAASVNAAYADFSRALLLSVDAPSLSWLAQHVGRPVSRQASLLRARV